MREDLLYKLRPGYKAPGLEALAWEARRRAKPKMPASKEAPRTPTLAWSKSSPQRPARR